jgi:hypothetical protein
LLGPVRRALHQLRLRLFPVRDPWQRLPYEAPLDVYGDGARHGFDWVFEGDSTIAVSSLDDILDWLGACQYETDANLFREADYWQHPHTFEQLRRGDCEDFALWAWRKLAEIGVEAEFCVGRVIGADDRPGMDRQHAWVLYRLDDSEFLFEPAARIRSRMIRPLADAADEYVPHFAVDHRFNTHAFAGCAYDSRRSRGTTSAPVGAV